MAKHDCGVGLQTIYRREGAGSDAVVRWCPKCGAVVVDEDFDGRTHPGAYMSMRFPESYRLQGSRIHEPTAESSDGGSRENP